MPLQLTGTASRVQKSTLKRSASSGIFNNSKRKKPSASSTPGLKKSKTQPEEDDVFESKLPDEGLLASLAADLEYSDVVQLIRYISLHQWSTIPESGAGMNSTRVAEILNFRRRLPPLVSVHHIHALSKYPTQTEREIGMLANRGMIRRVSLPPREVGGSSPGEALVLVEDWAKLIIERGDLEVQTKEKYNTLLHGPDADVNFTQDEVTALVRAGFLVGSSYLKSKADAYLRPGESTLGNLGYVAKAGINEYSGSAEAVASGARNYIAGGSGFNNRVSRPSAATAPRQEHNLTLPNIGMYLKLLHESRSHLLQLLAKSNRFRELPRSLLKERWDGGIAGNDEATKAQRLRGEWIGVVPGRTRKWRGFSGLEFQWVLEECLGAGLVECFKTGSVGLGVRAV